MACFHICIEGSSSRLEGDLSQALRRHLSEHSADLPGFRFAGVGWKDSDRGCLTAVLCDTRKDLEKTCKCFDLPKGAKLTIAPGEPITDLDEEDKAIAKAKKAEAAAIAAEEDRKAAIEKAEADKAKADALRYAQD